ncbi:hemolysin-III related-domain-containing protein [Tricladium varicosporioides]|nr:hemolysin-III related-domain-containing protein [Hymenoscyphus varicosporioides]
MASELDLRTERDVTNQPGADELPRTPEQGRSHRGHYLLLRWNDLPSWRQDNEYLLSGYRPSSGSFQKLNIYSHMLGAALFATLSICVYVEIHNRHTAIQVGDVLVFAVFFLGVVLCFSFSGIFHIMSNHSEQVAAFWNRLDYLGIVVLMWGSTVPSIYYGFYCDPNLQRLYWAVVSVLAVACAVAILAPGFQHPTFRPYRTSMYVSLGLSAMVFITHGLITYGWETQNHRMGLNYMLTMAMLNLLGAAIYTARIPERWYQLRYNIYRCSHQVFHFIVFFAGLAHMFGLLL